MRKHPEYSLPSILTNCFLIRGSLSYKSLKYDGKNPLAGTRNIVGVRRANNSLGGGVETIDIIAESG
jgi:hypothetical protein